MRPIPGWILFIRTDHQIRNGKHTLTNTLTLIPDKTRSGQKFIFFSVSNAQQSTKVVKVIGFRIKTHTEKDKHIHRHQNTKRQGSYLKNEKITTIENVRKWEDGGRIRVRTFRREISDKSHGWCRSPRHPRQTPRVSIKCNLILIFCQSIHKWITLGETVSGYQCGKCRAKSRQTASSFNYYINLYIYVDNKITHFHSVLVPKDP